MVCKSCGSEVSPYVTECPYCGHRLRKRAPKLERAGDEIKVKEGRRERRARKRAEKAEQRRQRLPKMPELDLDASGGPPLAVIGVLLSAALLLVVQRAVPLFPGEVGAVIGPLDGEWWRALTAPFVFDDLGYLIACGAAIAIFGTSLERRLGTLPVLILAISAGALGVLVAAEAAGSDVVAGANGIGLAMVGAWAMFARRRPTEPGEIDWDMWGAAAAASVLLLLPLVEVTADPVAGISGGIWGVLMGEVGARGRSRD